MNQLISLSSLDFGMILVCLLSSVVGIIRGFLKEVISLVGWIAALGLAWMYHPIVAEPLLGFVHNQLIAQLLAMVAIIVMVVLVTVVIHHCVKSLTKPKIALSINRILGFGFGFARGIILVLILLMIARTTGWQTSDSWKQSTLAPLVHDVLPEIEALFNQYEMKMLTVFQTSKLQAGTQFDG